MGKHLHLPLILLLLLTGPFMASAQKGNGRSTNTEELKKIAEVQEKKFKDSKEKALQQAKKHNWVISHTAPDGSTISLEGIDEHGKPIYYITDNTVAAKTTNTSNLWGGGSSGVNISGSGPALAGKLGIWDGGAIRATHQEFNGRIINRDNSSDINGHATHVAGTMMAKGINSLAKGMAYGIANLQSWKFDYDGPEIAAAAGSLLISNHSYGYLAGWRYINGSWYWMGNINVSETEDVYFGYYDENAQLWDNIAFNAPYYLMVKAAGNSNNMSEPAVGTPYYRFNPAVNNWELVTSRSADMRSYRGYDVIPDHSVSKNILTVGAIHGLTSGYTQPSEVKIASFSSWGPTDDGRIKPDLVGDGVAVLSTSSGSDTDYSQGNGTSMAAPGVSGALVLLQEHFSNLNNGNFMRAATLKGLAIHTAQEAGAAPGPDYTFGWGVLNTEQGAKILSNAGKAHQILESVLNQNTLFTQDIIAAGTEPLRATISWTDPAGAVLPMIPSTLNNRTPRLVNDLDIRVTRNGQTYLPWVLDPANPSAAATTGDNIRDNVEQILINNPDPGAVYTITVTHKGNLTNTQQDYSLIISGLQGTQYCASASSSALNSRIESVEIGAAGSPSTSGCSTYSDFTSVITQVEAGQVIPVDVTVGSCGTQAAKIVKVFVDWNEDGDFNDANETAATSPVIPNTETFNANIQAPTTLRIGNTTRMRIVVMETSDSGLVAACGLYDKGETEDYSLKFVQSSTDVGIIGITIPGNSNFYQNPTQLVTVKLKNFGSSAQTNIPVTVNIESSGNVVASLTGIYPGSLGAYEAVDFLLPQNFATASATQYTFTGSTALSSDQNNTNNQYTTSLITEAASTDPVVTATSCQNKAAVSLKGTGDGTIYWYDAPAGGNLLAIGANSTTTYKHHNKIYYAALNEYAAQTVNLQNNLTGTFASDTASTFFNASAPFMLDKVRLQASSAGTLNIILISPEKETIGSTQLQIYPGTADYALNFTVPEAGNNYRLLISSFGGAALNRNDGAGSVVFPDTSSAVVSITGTSRGGTYFYLYNWSIRATGSPSKRVAVKANGTLTATTAAVCPGINSGTLTLNQFADNIVRWESTTDSVTWTAINNTTYTYAFANLAKTTLFRAIISDGNCAEAISDLLAVRVYPAPTAIITANENTTLCAGQSVSLTANAGTSYLWSTGEATQSIIVSTAGNYTVAVTDTNGCVATSAPLSVTTNQTVWTGAMDSDWFKTGNWSCQVPDVTSDVTIPANSINYPIITTGTAICHNLTIQDSLKIDGGLLHITGNFINNGVYLQAAGTLELTGTSDQQISGGTFLHLKINSAATTTLASDIIVNGSLTMNNGTLTTGAHKIILGAQANLTETEDAYITGRVEAICNFTSSTTSHAFGNIGARITTLASPGNIRILRVSNTNTLNTLQFINRYYDIHVESGANTNLDATLDFTYLPHELNAQAKEELILYRSTDNGLNWLAQESSTADAGAQIYKVTLTGIEGFSMWTAGNRSEPIALPVSLIAFEAEKKKDDVLLTWATASETNSKGMEIEVSADAKNYRNIGFVAAKAADSQFRQNYRFTDTETGKTGTRYYRLKQLDLDGKSVYYGPRVVQFSTANQKLTAYPNPAKGNFQVAVSSDTEEQMQLEIRNMSGQLVYTTVKKLRKGSNRFSVQLPSRLPAGLYSLTTRAGSKEEHIKLILQ